MRNIKMDCMKVIQFNEVIYKDDVLVLEAGQYVDEKGGFFKLFLKLRVQE